MKFSHAIVLLLLVSLFILAGLAFYFYTDYGARGVVGYAVINGTIANESSYNATQFYPNMRYRSRLISYFISPDCYYSLGNDNYDRVFDAFEVLVNWTSIRFYQGGSENSSELIITCSNIAPDSGNKSFIIAGEGGPYEIINASAYSVIINGKISLFKPEKCLERDKPYIVLREIFHALGFDHTNDKMSIMYPEVNCKQKIPDYLIDEVNRLYLPDSLPDLAIANLSANKTGRYLNFNIAVGNFGLADSKNSTVEIYSGRNNIRNFSLGAIEIGTKKSLSVRYVAVGRGAMNVSFVVNSFESELSKSNNVGLVASNS